MAHLKADISFADAAIARLYQSVGLPFLFVPINAIAYVGLAQTKTAQASSLLNVFRNLGGTFGISVSQTLLAGYQQVHPSYLVDSLNQLTTNYPQWLGNAQGVFGEAITPRAVLYKQDQRQAPRLALSYLFHWGL